MFIVCLLGELLEEYGVKILYPGSLHLYDTEIKKLEEIWNHVQFTNSVGGIWGFGGRIESQTAHVVLLFLLIL